MPSVINEVLPVGSVVRLRGADALVMVIGYEPSIGDEKADYLAVVHPVGMVSERSAVTFDCDAIEEVLYEGYLDDEGRRAFEAIRAYRQASADLAQQIEDFAQSLTPERVQALAEEYAPSELPPDFVVPEGLEDLAFT